MRVAGREVGGPFPIPAGRRPLANAFHWPEWRTVSMHGNRYPADPGLAGRRVEPAFDPFDLTVLSVRCGSALIQMRWLARLNGWMAERLNG